MKKNFGFDTEFNKLRSIARSLWMGCERGEGELEIDDQGRFDQSRFSQETEGIGQQTPRIGEDRPKLRFTPDTQVSARVSSAGRTLNSDSTPQFFSPALSATIEPESPPKNLQLKATQAEKACFYLAQKTQMRVAALFKAAKKE
ncbi:MAG: hypothetical protein ACAH59_03565 [Pseudobdellovibrionaceae bacterium]